MKSANIKTKQQDNSLIIIINRPDKKNALTADMYSDLAEEIKKAEKNTDLSSIIITGTADSFCAGNDLKDFLENPPDSEDSPVFEFLKAIAECKLPLIAAVNGVAVGVGVTMLLHCDFAYAEEDVKMSLPFINLGLVPEAASSLLLPEIVGYNKAAELLMLGESFSAKQAKNLGLVNELCPSNTALSKALEVAKKLAEKPREALIHTKKLLKRDKEPVVARLSAEAEVFKKRLKSAESKEAISAVIEKRKPNFKSFKK